ncbi:helix-turn-helix domain-containing protein, partial [Ligilactobacillus equi]|uniref:helix-turn-helix domain-containing protein n=1 Tax=Ligilactobacillus equi TaxID=137357 RepID=UPI002ED4C485
QLSYHYGLKVRIYPSSQQKAIIKRNSDVARTVYNKLIAIDKELYQLKKVKLPIATVIDRIKELEKRKNPKELANHYRYMLNKNID